MIRLASYLASCAILAAVLWLMAVSKPELVMVSLWAIAWLVALIVTWTVARREGRNAIGWAAAALLVGPLAWVAIAMARPDARAWERPADPARPSGGNQPAGNDPGAGVGVETPRD
jgi:hypothetical protein